MPMIQPSQAATFDRGNTVFTGLAAPSRGARENAVWRVRVGPGTEALTHRLTREEIIVATAGKARVMLDGSEQDFAAGSAIVIAADTDFALANPFEEVFEAVAVLPVGGQAIIGADAPFTPPWAE